VVILVDIDIEQCRENDKIKDIISKSGLAIKYIKLLLRLSDAIYINAINYNVQIEDNNIVILLISSKPDNKTGQFSITSLTNVLYKIRDMAKENQEIKTICEVDDKIIKIIINIEE